jgi:hypothetical protein
MVSREIVVLVPGPVRLNRTAGGGEARRWQPGRETRRRRGARVNRLDAAPTMSGDCLVASTRPLVSDYPVVAFVQGVSL